MENIISVLYLLLFPPQTLLDGTVALNVNIVSDLELSKVGGDLGETMGTEGASKELASTGTETE